MFFYELILYLVEFLKFAVVYRLAFDFEWRKKWYVFPCDVVILCAGATYYTWWEYAWNPSIVYVIMVVLFSVISFVKKGKWYRILGILGWTLIVSTLIDATGYMMLYFPNERINEIGASIITLCFLMFCLKFIRRKSRDIFRKIPIGYYIAFALIGLINEFVLSALFMIAKTESRYLWAFILVVLGVFLQMTTVFLLAVANQTWKEKEQLNKEYLSALEEHYRYLGKKEEETKKFRHDVRNHLYTLDELVRQGREEEYHCYMKEIFGILESPSYHVDTGNRVVDAIINQYAVTFREEGITFILEGHLPADCFVASFDLCVLFSNMLQNALEAVRKWEKKEIKILLRYDDYGIFIHEENTFNTIQMKDNFLVTSKKNHAVHGYGSANMRDSIKKYNGTIEYTAENHRFGVTIYLQRPMDGRKGEAGVVYENSDY